MSVYNTNFIEMEGAAEFTGNGICMEQQTNVTGADWAVGPPICGFSDECLLMFIYSSPSHFVDCYYWYILLHFSYFIWSCCLWGIRTKSKEHFKKDKKVKKNKNKKSLLRPNLNSISIAIWQKSVTFKRPRPDLVF